MIARAAEANPSCFSRSGLADPISEVIPKLLRVVSKAQPLSASASPPTADQKSRRFPLSLSYPPPRPDPTDRKHSQAMVTQNHYSNTKYILNAMSLFDSPTPPTRETNGDVKQKMNKAKSYGDMADVFGIDRDEVRALMSSEEVDGMARLEELLPRWKQRRDEILSRDESSDRCVQITP